MPIALTVFGISIDSNDLKPCYVLLRTVRGPGEYPRPTLPRSAGIDCLHRTPVVDTALWVVTWDKILSKTEELAIQNEVDQGRLTIPAECPIGSGETITGLPFGPLIMDEQHQRARITGIGALYRKGFASDRLFVSIQDLLNQRLEPGTAPKALNTLISKIGALSGIDGIFKKNRNLAMVDYFYRAAPNTAIDGPLFEVIPKKPDFRTKAPMLQVYIRRHTAPLGEKFRVHVTLGNYDRILTSILVEIKADELETLVSAPAHITEASLSVFDTSGVLADQLTTHFLQSFQFQISALGAVDELPPPFAGSPEASDLVARPRMHNTAFEGPSITNRSGGLDVLQSLAVNVSMLIGPISQERENIWFERGVEGQLEVIRWIKQKIEKANIIKAYLFDPYLGSEALERVVTRQGNDSAELFIVVSPGDINPDAETTATTASSDYLSKLAFTATEWSEKLAGRISIINIKRGNGSKQAFHDRYLCTIDHKNIPTVYLLSNSLSKAAGDWPFAICELDRVMSWRIYGYMLDLINHRAGRNLQPEVIWNSSTTLCTTQPDKKTTSAALPKPQPGWANIVDAFVYNIGIAVTRNQDFKPHVSAQIEAFLRAWPNDVNINTLGDELFKVIGHREVFVVFVSDIFRNGGQIELANILSDKLLEKFLDMLPDPAYKSGWFVAQDALRAALENLSRSIARRQNATNFIREKFNSKINELITIIETQRFDLGIDWDAHQASLAIAVIALQFSITADDTPKNFRIGIATDYIHWLGRLMRADIANSIFRAHGTETSSQLDNLVLAANVAAQARLKLGEPLDAPIDRLKDDPCVVPIFKEKLAAFLAD